MRALWIGVVVIVMAMFMQSSAAAQKQEGPKHQKQVTTQVAPDVFVCPMHSDVTSAKAGTCSKCGMALEKKVQKSHAGKHATRGQSGHNGHSCCASKEKCGGCEGSCGDR